jgi:Fe-S-cluster-containing dehydrogenase component/CRP-like cAMP-binding protein
MARQPVELQRPERWDNPFSPDMSREEVDRVLGAPPLNEIEVGNFPSTASLRDVIRNDTRIRRFERGDIIVRQGDYGNSAFFVLSGTARVILQPPLPAEALGRKATRRRGIVQAVKQLWSNAKLPEVRDVSRFGGDAQVRLTRSDGDEVRVTLRNPEKVIRDHRTATFEPGGMFGEIAAIARAPRTATIYSDTGSEMLEIRWQGLRDIRRRDVGFRERVDQAYRKHGLAAHLRESPLLKEFKDEQISEIAHHTRFASYGEVDRPKTYRALEKKNDGERFEDEPIIVTEDQVADSLIMVRSGFVRVSERVDHGHRTVSYLGPGDLFGLAEIVHNSRLPHLPPSQLPPPIKPRGGARPAWQPDDVGGNIEPAMLEFLVDNRFINGTAAMVIDTDRCTRCDECVKACASSHNNNPRFVRHGLKYGNFMIANACMHCVDPVCLIGCPTGAIHRNVEAGQVVINDDTCIGCGNCAGSCPYNNIRLVGIRDESGGFILDEQTNAPLEKATKCDLCADQIGGPACQRACPNDALIRINLRDLDRLAEWVSR